MATESVSSSAQSARQTDEQSLEDRIGNLVQQMNALAATTMQERHANRHLRVEAERLTELKEE